MFTKKKFMNMKEIVQKNIQNTFIKNEMSSCKNRLTKKKSENSNTK